MSNQEVICHYDLLIVENNDPLHDPLSLQEYMNKWDGNTFLNELNLSHNMSALEIGVGTGRLAIKTAPLCESFTGIDISLKTIERAKENLLNSENVKLICGDFSEYEFAEKFDVIYSSLTFMHFSDKLSTVQKAASLLKTGGKLVISIDKNQTKYIDMGDRKLRIYPDNPVNLSECMKTAGLSVVKKTETEFAYILSGQCGGY